MIAMEALKIPIFNQTYFLTTPSQIENQKVKVIVVCCMSTKVSFASTNPYKSY